MDTEQGIKEPNLRASNLRFLQLAMHMQDAADGRWALGGDAPVHTLVGWPTELERAVRLMLMRHTAINAASMWYASEGYTREEWETIVAHMKTGVSPFDLFPGVHAYYLMALFEPNETMYSEVDNPENTAAPQWLRSCYGLEQLKTLGDNSGRLERNLLAASKLTPPEYHRVPFGLDPVGTSERCERMLSLIEASHA